MQINRVIPAATLLLTLLLTPVAAKDNESAQKLKIATEYVEQTVADFDFDALVETMWLPIISEVERNGRVVSDDQKAAIRNLYSENFIEPLRALMLKQTDALIAIYTLEELVALRDFYRTREGREVMRKLPKLVEMQQPGMISIALKAEKIVIPQAMEILYPQGK